MSQVLLRLPPSLVDFERRGFRLDRPDARAELETHCRGFVHGFNSVARSWRDPHAVLADVPVAERGFAYEGAAMRAALRDLAGAGRARAFPRLLEGAGDGYVHLAHVGHGWALAVAGVPLPTAMPATPLLRWLAVDGAGFARTFFGGRAALRRLAGRSRRDARWILLLNGAGRALWFLESADVPGVAATLAALPAPARPHLWAGVGLACSYAGAADPAQLAALDRAVGPHRQHLQQGVMFGVAARRRAGHLPEHTTTAATTLLGVSAEQAASWTDDAAVDLTARLDVQAYLLWRARLRAVVGEQAVTPIGSADPR